MGTTRTDAYWLVLSMLPSALEQLMVTFSEEMNSLLVAVLFGNLADLISSALFKSAIAFYYAPERIQEEHLSDYDLEQAFATGYIRLLSPFSPPSIRVTCGMFPRSVF